MSNHSSFELKVGIFVFIGLIILTALIFSVGDFYIFRRGVNYDLIFKFVNGLEPGAPVRISGVESGEVERIKLYYDKASNEVKVKIHIWVEEGVKLRKDAKAYINTLGLMGEKYLELYPGTPNAAILDPQEILVGSDPISTEELTHKGQQTLEKLDRLIEAMNKIMDEETRINLRKTIANASDTSEGAKNFVKSANNLLASVESGEGTIGKLFYDDSLYNELESFVQDLKRHPWKLLKKGKEEKVDKKNKKDQENTSEKRSYYPRSRR